MPSAASSCAASRRAPGAAYLAVAAVAAPRPAERISKTAPTSVNTAAAETGRVSTEIAQAANDLDAQATFLRDQMDGFVSRVRAA